MIDLDTLARHHAERVRESVATAVTPPIPEIAAGRSPWARVPKPLWAVLAAVAILVLVGLPFLLRDDSAIDPEPVMTIPEEKDAGFTPTGRLNSDCSLCSALLLADGRVLVHAGETEIYDPESGTFTATDSPDWAGYTISSTLLRDGRVLATDGVIQWLFDPVSESFEVAGDVPAVQVASLGDGRVLMLGGSRRGEGQATFIYDSGSISEGPPTLFAYGDAATTKLVSLLDGRVLLMGDSGTEIFDPGSESFTSVGERLDRGGFTATVLDDGRVLIAGGQETVEPYALVEIAEIFDPATGQFAPTGPMSWGRVWHAAALLPDGRVLVVGGGADLLDVVDLDQAEVYDPAGGEFELVPFEMTRERIAPVAVTLNDGSVLILGHYPGNGGFGSRAGSSTAEIFTFDSVSRSSAGTENPTEVEVAATYDLGDLPPEATGQTALEARLVAPPGSLEGMTELIPLATLDVEGEPSTGMVTTVIGAPVDQTLLWDFSEGPGGTGGGGGPVILPEDCTTACELTIPISINWTAPDGLPPAVLGLRLQVAYAGQAPAAAGDIQLIIAAP